VPTSDLGFENSCDTLTEECILCVLLAPWRWDRWVVWKGWYRITILCCIAFERFSTQVCM